MEFEILHAIQGIRNETLDIFMAWYTTIGDHGLIWIFLSIGLLAFAKTRFLGKVCLLSLLLEVLAVTFTLKPLIDRVRPCMTEALQAPLAQACYTNPSFPSGHTAAAFAVAAAILCVNKTWGMIALMSAALMGFTRLYFFVHFPSDVLAGAIVGSLCGYLAYRIYSRYDALKNQAQ